MQVPGYLAKQAELKSKGVSDVIVYCALTTYCFAAGSFAQRSCSFGFYTRAKQELTAMSVAAGGLDDDWTGCSSAERASSSRIKCRFDRWSLPRESEGGFFGANKFKKQTAEYNYTDLQSFLPKLFMAKRSFEIQLQQLNDKKAAPKAIKEIPSQAAYTGRLIAIDASMCLYQFLIMIRENRSGTYNNLTNEEGQVTSHIIGMLTRTIRLMENGIKPVYVFDGKPPEMKRVVHVLHKRFSSVVRWHLKETKKLLRLMGVPVVDAPSEAEATCAALCRDGKVFAAATEDWKLWNPSSFFRPSTAIKLLVQHGTLEKVLEALGSEKVPENFRYEAARMFFKECEAVDTTLCDFKFEEPDIEGLSKFLVEDRGLKNSKSKTKQRPLDMFFGAAKVQIKDSEKFEDSQCLLMSRFEDRVPTASVRTARRSIQAILDSIDDLLLLVPQNEQEAAKAVADTRTIPTATLPLRTKNPQNASISVNGANATKDLAKEGDMLCYSFDPRKSTSKLMEDTLSRTNKTLSLLQARYQSSGRPEIEVAENNEPTRGFSIEPDIADEVADGMPSWQSESSKGASNRSSPEDPQEVRSWKSKSSSHWTERDMRDVDELVDVTSTNSKGKDEGHGGGSYASRSTDLEVKDFEERSIAEHFGIVDCICNLI
eukprot:g13055.t1